ncbi:AAA family ATPase [Xylanibacter brevis]|uniref:AAA family ATPase n=1 Tax=Xylanibacter brevis TaxID=83231 RepID=UPI003B67D806
MSLSKKIFSRHLSPDKTRKSHLDFRTKDGDLLSLDKLSAGEKQLMLILLTVFLMDEEQYVLLMDEPELSLHIEWQSKLIKALRKLNKNCQLIITTHSPSIFASGWQNKLVYMDEIVEE